jgi:hypothetical protein
VETYEPDLPPCEKCPLPPRLYPKNREALEMWRKSYMARGTDVIASGVVRPARLGPMDIKALCEGLGGDHEHFERMLLIESIAYPWICKECMRHGAKH